MDLIKASIAIRQKMNRKILLELSKRIENNPTMRFGQIMADALPKWREEGLVKAGDLLSQVYNEEPAVQLARLVENRDE